MTDSVCMKIFCVHDKIYYVMKYDDKFYEIFIVCVIIIFMVDDKTYDKIYCMCVTKFVV